MNLICLAIYGLTICSNIPNEPVTTYRVSYYSNDYCVKHNPGCITASGEKFDDTKFTAACSSRWRLGQRLRLTYKDNSVEIVCNDRGSFSEKYGRALDLSKAAFEALSPLSYGVIRVFVDEI